MSIGWRLVGGGLVIVAALIASGEYKLYAKRRILQYEGFAALLFHLEGMISRYLSSGDGLYRGFENAELERIGFLLLIRGGDRPAEALRKCDGQLCLSKECRKALSDFFVRFGRDYKDREIKSILDFRTGLEEEKKSEAERLEKSVKVFSALSIGGALAFFIMII
jgi:hypothetical protein